MSSKLIPKNPAESMVIRDISPNVVIFSVPFARAGIFQVGGRATLSKQATTTSTKVHERIYD
jgi:hypothetical protein